MPTLTLTQDQLRVLAFLIPAAPFLAVAASLVATIRRRNAPLPASRRMEIALGWATRGLSAISLLCTILLAAGGPENFPLEPNWPGVDIYLDALSVYFLLLVNLVAFFASWYTVEFLRFYRDRPGQQNPVVFHLFFNLFHVTMLIVPMVDNLAVLWIAVELTTLASVLLVRYLRGRRALEAAWKYIIITTAGIVFALFGTLLLVDTISDKTCSVISGLQDLPGACDGLDSNQMLRWSLLARPEVAATLDRNLIALAFLFVLVGYGAKAGLAPMHTWLPDGHGEAPSPVSALLSGVLLKSALYAILRFVTITNLARADEGRLTSGILLFTGLGSLILATPFILKPNRFKRVLAYHSLEHMGIIVFGVGINSSLALFGALLHALNHALTKALMFLSFSQVRYAYAAKLGLKEPDEEQVTGVLRAMPANGSLLLLGGLGLVGSPPFNIFLSEFIILYAALDRAIHPPASEKGLPPQVYAVAAALFLVTVTLIFGGLVAHLGPRLLGRPEIEKVHERWQEVLPLVLLIGLVLLFGLWLPTWPVDFPSWLNASVAILQGGAR